RPEHSSLSVSSDCLPFLSVFFQAEDGIRDRNVTGVQTCALPIWLSRINPRVHAVNVNLNTQNVNPPPTMGWVHPRQTTLVRVLRSEERRVGKECRSGWRTGDYKKKAGMREIERDWSKNDTAHQYW